MAISLQNHASGWMAPYAFTLSSVIEVFARDRIITTQKTASYAAIDAMDNLYLVIRQYFTSIDTSHGCPLMLKTEPNSHTTIRRIAKIDLIETWLATANFSG